MACGCAVKSVRAPAWGLSSAVLHDVDAVCLVVGMSYIEWLMLLGAFAFIALLVFTADEIEGVEDDNDYNNPTTVQEGDRPGSQPNAVEDGAGTTGRGTERSKPSN